MAGARVRVAGPTVTAVTAITMTGRRRGRGHQPAPPPAVPRGCSAGSSSGGTLSGATVSAAARAAARIRSSIVFMLCSPRIRPSAASAREVVDLTVPRLIRIEAAVSSSSRSR